MAKEDLFNSIDLDTLANSESPVIADQGGGLPENPQTKEPNKPVEPENVEDAAGIDINEIASLGGKKTESEEDKDGLEDTSQKAPVNSNSDEDSPNTNKFTSFASSLSEAGVFKIDEEKLLGITDEESLVEAVRDFINDSRYTDLNEEQTKYLKALEAGIPTEVFAEHVKTEAVYENISEDHIKGNPTIQYNLISRKFQAKGFGEKESNKYAELSIKNGSGVADALKAKEDLVALNKANLEARINDAEQERIQKAKDEKDLLDSLTKTIQESSDLIPGVKINSTTKNKIIKSMVTPINAVDEEAQNEVMANYEKDPEYKAKLHALHVVTKGFTDFSKLNSKSKSKANSDLGKLLESEQRITSGSAKTGGFTSSSSNVAKALQQLKFN